MKKPVLIGIISFIFCCGVTTAQIDGVYDDLELALENKAQVKHLILSKKKLKKVPEEVYDLYNLEVLDLSKNKLKEFPLELTKMRKLRELDLASNDISELPKEIGNMKRLQKLDLFKNDIWQIPKEIGQLMRLEEINLNANPIFRLPDEMKSCTSLIYMDLRNTDMGEPERNHTRDSFPGVKIYFDSGCNCGPNN